MYSPVAELPHPRTLSIANSTLLIVSQRGLSSCQTMDDAQCAMINGKRL